jgi:hypothetical protein
LIFDAALWDRGVPVADNGGLDRNYWRSLGERREPYWTVISGGCAKVVVLFITLGVSPKFM